MQSRTRLALSSAFLALAGLQGSAEPANPAGLLNVYRWTAADPDFGGISGLEVAQDGLSLLALTDKGRLVSARLERDETGQIAAVTGVQMSPLLGRSGKPLKDDQSDSEGLALAKDGRLFVSFETPGRVMEYLTPESNAYALPKHPDFARMDVNAALEALAVDDQGTLYTLEERKGDADGMLTLYRLRNDAWDDILRIPQHGSFLAVGADIGPDGRLYLLQRMVIPPVGFANRLSRFDLHESGATNETLLMESSAGQYGNLESVSIWQDKGGMIATMVSDDNFLFFLPTQLVEIRLPD